MEEQRDRKETKHTKVTVPINVTTYRTHGSQQKKTIRIRSGRLGRKWRDLDIFSNVVTGTLIRLFIEEENSMEKLQTCTYINTHPLKLTD